MMRDVLPYMQPDGSFSYQPPPGMAATGGQSSAYKAPTSQLLVVKGTSCIEPVSLPNMQTYFSNVELAGREYGSFRILHFDFPLNDSLVKTFGANYIPLRIVVDMEWVDPSLDTITTDDNALYGDLQFTQDFMFEVRRTHTTAEVVISLTNAISQMIITNSDGPKTYWQEWLTGIVYDQATQKIVLQFASPPNSNGTWNGNVLQRLVFTLSGPQTGQQAELAAAIFGGVVAPDASFWSAQWDTGRTSWFYNQKATTTKVIAENNVAPVLQVSGQRPPRMFVDPYVHITGTPEQSVWYPDGSTANIMTIQPRNRPPGVITNQQAFLGGQTHSVRTSLHALRSMNMRFTDSAGRLLKVDEEYVVKILIEFQS